MTEEYGFGQALIPYAKYWLAFFLGALLTTLGTDVVIGIGGVVFLAMIIASIIVAQQTDRKIQ